MLTGGGPGAMEAANLGALAPTTDAVDVALDRLAAVPSFRPSVEAWAELALQVRADLGAEEGAARSYGIPTWFYGHEPPNVFCDGIAKYFSNALRENVLLAQSTGGLVVLPGAAGTVQEIVPEPPSGERVRVVLRTAPVLVAEVTREAVGELGLVEGTPVFAAFKATGVHVYT